MNIIDAIKNLVNNPVTTITATYRSRNRANAAGDALEEYIKDLFAGTFEETDEMTRLRRIGDVFSYLGNASNPPDSMLRGGDAIEVKKIEAKGSALALNSSHPKHTLKVTSSLINQACKDAEEWTEKDMIYTIGLVKNSKLQRLCMVYGLDYCASEECYLGLKTRIKESIEMTPNVDFTESKEIGHVNKVDPLGITYMRIRGMWGIENPWKVFSYVYTPPANKEFDFMCIINEDKYNTFANKEELETLANETDNMDIKDVMIKDPDNPAKLRGAKLITFFKE